MRREEHSRTYENLVLSRFQPFSKRRSMNAENGAYRVMVAPLPCPSYSIACRILVLI